MANSIVVYVRNEMTITQSCAQAVWNRSTSNDAVFVSGKPIFVCKCSTAGTLASDDADSAELDAGNAVVLQRVDRFCYLDDMLEADGRSDIIIIIITGIFKVA